MSAFLPQKIWLLKLSSTDRFAIAAPEDVEIVSLLKFLSNHCFEYNEIGVEEVNDMATKVPFQIPEFTLDPYICALSDMHMHIRAFIDITKLS